MSQKPKEMMRFATTDPNKENKYHNQIKKTGVNQQRSKDANKNITKAGPSVYKREERADVSKNVNESLTVQKDDLKLHVEKWRAERQARLAAKIVKKLGKTDVPAAVLGVSGYNVSLDTTVKSMDFSVNATDNRKPDSQKNKKSNTKAKKKPVEVRQTTASRLRMEKANPLLTIGKCTGLSSTFKLKTPATAQVRSTNIARERITATKSTAAPKQLFKVPKCNEMKVNIGKKNAGQVQQKSSMRAVKKSPSTFTPVNRIKQISANISGVARLPQSTQKKKPQLSASARQKNVPTAKLNTGLRRSSSATTLRSQVTASVSGVAKLPQSVQKNKAQPSKSVTEKNVPAPNQRTGLRRSSSATTFHSQVSLLKVNSLRSPSVPDVSRASTVNHSSAYKSAAGLGKQETCIGFSDTPHRSSLRKSRVTLFSTPHMKTPLKTVSFTPQPDMLRRNLISWLEKRGKSLNSFGHLRCFGIHKPASEKMGSCVKESAVLATKVSEGKEQSEIAQGDSKVLTNEEVKDRTSDNEDDLDNCSLEDLKNILSDLHKLILASYPREQCEEWLHLIRRKFPNLDDEPSYWECLAALEEARGDYSTAIEFYSRAIVSGAETEVIDKSLDLLWEKFTSLKLQSKDKEDKKKQKTPRRSVDPCQVFKSSIIKFALQQKAVKQLSADLGVEPKSLHYVATPVRRSTRKSNNPYKSSTVVCVGSLNTLQPDVRDSVVFVSNAALTPTV